MAGNVLNFEIIYLGGSVCSRIVKRPINLTRDIKTR